MSNELATLGYWNARYIRKKCHTLSHGMIIFGELPETRLTNDMRKLALIPVAHGIEIDENSRSAAVQILAADRVASAVDADAHWPTLTLEFS